LMAVTGRQRERARRSVHVRATERVCVSVGGVILESDIFM
jgi:hypothetical protein